MGGTQRATRAASRSAAVAAEKPCFRARAPDFGAGLPHELLLRIWALVPVGSRARCALVCRAWRRSLDDAAAWRVCDLDTEGFFSNEYNDPRHARWLASASARAGGCLEALVLGEGYVADTAICEVLAANAGSMRVLDLRRKYTTGRDLETYSRAAPGLTCLDVDKLFASADDGLACLRREAHFAAVRFKSMQIYAKADDAAALLRFFAELERHKLTELEFCFDGLAQPGVCDAMVSAALACNLKELKLMSCQLTTECAPALARLLSSKRLSSLLFHENGANLLDRQGALQIAAALRANTTLKTLILQDVGLWEDVAAGVAVTVALTNHPTIHTLALVNVDPPHLEEDVRATAGAALGGLIAANCDVLHSFDIRSLGLGDEGLRFVTAALPLNTNLDTLCLAGNNMTAEFVREHLIPAVDANTTLTYLELGADWDDDPEPEDIAILDIFREVEDRVWERSQQR